MTAMVGVRAVTTREEQAPITPAAEKDLKQLAQRYQNFKFVFIGNTHRKTLVSDDAFAVVTSFNWLSFRGDPRAKPRDESGVVIRKKAYVDDTFEKSLSLLEAGTREKPPAVHSERSDQVFRSVHAELNDSKHAIWQLFQLLTINTPRKLSNAQMWVSRTSFLLRSQPGLIVMTVASILP